MKEYDFVKVEMANGDIAFFNLMKIALCIVKEDLIQITLLSGDEYTLNKETGRKLIDELEFWSVNNE